MSAVSRLIDKLAGRDPADVVAEAAYKAMCAPTPVTKLAARLAEADQPKRKKLLAAAGDATRVAVLEYLREAEPTRENARRLAWLRADAQRLAAVKRFYASHLGDFIADWGYTTDPRLIAKNKSAMQRFALWPKQRDLVDFVLQRFERGELGVVVKSRDVGASWVAMALLVSLCVFRDKLAAGIASATEVKMDRSGDPDTLFHKGREFAKHLPAEFNGGFDGSRETNAYMRMSFPVTGSSITGEAGDQAGRGGRKSLYIVDEAAHFERPKLIDSALAATTDCRIDISSVNGNGNSFFDKAHNPAIPRFDITWRDDPRKNFPGSTWYADKVATLDPIIVAQEIDCNFAASVEGVIIPNEHVQAAIDLDVFLGVTPTGIRMAALDVGDRGDRNAFAVRHGCQLESVQSWSGKSGDIFSTTQRAFRLCDEFGLREFTYDADGLGAGVRGDARVINEQRAAARGPVASATPAEYFAHQSIAAKEYRGSATPVHPTKLVPRTNRKNEDFFANRKAQSWLHLQSLFREAYKARMGLPYDKAAYISINGKIPELGKLVAELSQATVSETAAGKMLVDKIGEGKSSPNLADAVVMCFAPRLSTMTNMGALLRAVSAVPPSRGSFGATFGN
ncbi:MAG: TerL protein [Steroidobacteraceae bacterium]